MRRVIRISQDLIPRVNLSPSTNYNQKPPIVNLKKPGSSSERALAYRHFAYPSLLPSRTWGQETEANSFAVYWPFWVHCSHSLDNDSPANSFFRVQLSRKARTLASPSVEPGRSQIRAHLSKQPWLRWMPSALCSGCPTDPFTFLAVKTRSKTIQTNVSA
jgi:hypothetical protein